MRFRFVLIAGAALVLLTACSHSRTYGTGNGSATVTGSGANQTVTVHTNEGTGTFGKNAVDPASLGLPLYPGAEASQTAGYSATTKTGSGSVLVMTTADGFDKVYAWYKAQMPAGSEQMHMSAGTGSIAEFLIGKNGDKQQKTVMIASDKDKTSITLSDTTKN